MKKKKTGKAGIVAVVAGVLAVAALSVFVTGWSSCKDENTEIPPSGDSTTTENPTDDVTIDISGVYQIGVLNTATTELGGENGKIVFTGSTDGATLRAIGNGGGTIKAATGGELVFKNLIIEDETTDTSSVLYATYLRFGGQLRFENCTFTDSIYLMNDANATFENCTFRSTRTSCYSVWLADGSASFESCTFTGYRGFKTHEFTYGNVETDGDVENVTINNCTFLELTEKVGVVFGKFETNPTNTSIQITNSKFIDCQAWDKEGSLSGVDGFYETDMDLEEINFIQSNNVIEFSAHQEEVEAIS